MKEFFNKYKIQTIISLAVIIVVIVSIVLVNIFYFRTARIDDFYTRGIWLSYQDLTLFDVSSEKSLKEDIEEVKDTMDNYHLNTLYLQVRPFSDAIYDSSLFPQSLINDESYNIDILECFIESFKDTDKEIVAWINPYRISLDQKHYEYFRNESIHSSWLDDDHTITYDDYKTILNPSNTDAQEYILDGIKEVLEYDVSGIIFDDYFYVPGTQDDTTLESRQEDVNTLIQQVYTLVHHSNKTFGISCQGNYDNCINEGANVDLWLSTTGYIDYLMPQIYWSDDYNSIEDGNVEMFTTRAKLFSRIKRNKNISLYVSFAIYKCGIEDETDAGWGKSSNNLSTQLQTIFRKYSGYSFYSYRHVLLDTSKEELETLMNEHEYKE